MNDEIIIGTDEKLVDVVPDHIYMMMPPTYVCVYHKLLVYLADFGKNLLEDCTAACKPPNKTVIDCWNMFQSAVAYYNLGNTKDSETIIKYINAQIDLIYRGTGESAYEPTPDIFTVPVSPDGLLVVRATCNGSESSFVEDSNSDANPDNPNPNPKPRYNLTCSQSPENSAFIVGVGRHWEGDLVQFYILVNSPDILITDIVITGGYYTRQSETRYYITMTSDVHVHINFEKVNMLTTGIKGLVEGATISSGGKFKNGVEAPITISLKEGYEVELIDSSSNVVELNPERTSFNAIMNKDAHCIATIRKIPIKRFTITGIVLPAAASGSLEGLGTYDENSIVPIIIRTQEWDRIESVVITGSEYVKVLQNEYNILVTADTNIVVTLIDNEELITNINTEIVGGAITGAGLYPKGSIVESILTVNPGYEVTYDYTNNVTKISDDGIFPIIFSSKLDYKAVIIVSFTLIPKYNLICTTEAPATITGTGVYEVGERIYSRITLDNYQDEIAGYQKDNVLSEVVGSDRTLHIVNLIEARDGSFHVVINRNRNIKVFIVDHTVDGEDANTSIGGTFTGLTGLQPYGNTYEIDAKPNDGWEYEGYTASSLSDIDHTTNGITETFIFVLTGDVQLRIHFKPKPKYNLICTANGNAVATGSGQYQVGKIVRSSVTLNNYNDKIISIDAINVDYERVGTYDYNVKLKSPMDGSIHFNIKERRSLTVSMTGNGNYDGHGYYDLNSIGIITVFPDKGYEIKSVMANLNITPVEDSTNKWSVVMTDTCIVTIILEPIKYVVSLVSNPTDLFNVEGLGEYNAGSKVRIGLSAKNEMDLVKSITIGAPFDKISDTEYDVLVNANVNIIVEATERRKYSVRNIGDVGSYVVTGDAVGIYEKDSALNSIITAETGYALDFIGYGLNTIPVFGDKGAYVTCDILLNDNANIDISMIVGVIPNHTVTLASNKVTLINATNLGEYEHGSSARVVLSAKNEMDAIKITSVVGGSYIIISDTEVDLIVTDNIIIYADVIEQKRYNLIDIGMPNSYTITGHSSGLYPKSSKVETVITANEGYDYSSFSYGRDTSVRTRYGITTITATLNNDVTVGINVTNITNTLTIESYNLDLDGNKVEGVPHGTVSIDTTEYPAGWNGSFRIYPESGYTYEIECSPEVTASTIRDMYNFVMNGDKFAIIKFKLNVSSKPIVELYLQNSGSLDYYDSDGILLDYGDERSKTYNNGSIVKIKRLLRYDTPIPPKDANNIIDFYARPPEGNRWYGQGFTVYGVTYTISNDFVYSLNMFNDCSMIGNTVLD